MHVTRSFTIKPRVRLPASSPGKRLNHLLLSLIYMMAATAARPHSVAYSDKRRSASADFAVAESSAKRSASTSQARKSRSKSPQIVGQYILYSTLGQGSMGKVKLARHRKTGQLVRWYLTLLGCAFHFGCAFLVSTYTKSVVL